MSKLTDKDLEEAMKKMEGHKNPDSFKLNPQASMLFGQVINMLEQLDGEVELIFDNRVHKLTLKSSPAPQKDKV